MNSKTTTFVVDQTCDPTNWTARDLVAFRDFIAHGGNARAAPLARLGLKVVTSEHHQPLGGTLEEIGFARPVSPGDEVQLEDDVRNICDENGTDPAGVTKVVRIYQGPVQYAVGVPIGDGDGGLEGYEFEFKDTFDEAEALSRSIYADA